jgi:hypothetical protein
MTYKLTGLEPYQIPTNADLGTMAYQNSDAVQAGQVNVSNTLTVSGLIAPLTVGYLQSAAGTVLYLNQVPSNLMSGGTISGTGITAGTTITSFISGFSTYQQTYTANTASTLIAVTSTYGISTSFGVGGTGVTYGTVVSGTSNTGVPVTYVATSATSTGNVLYVGTTTNVAVNQIVLGTGVATGTYVLSIVTNASVTVSNSLASVTAGTGLTFVPTVTLSAAMTANTLTQNLLFFPTVTLNQNSASAVTPGTVVNAYYAAVTATNAAVVIQNGGLGVTGNAYFANNIFATGNIYSNGTLLGGTSGSATTSTNIFGGQAGYVPYQTAPSLTTVTNKLVFDGLYLQINSGTVLTTASIIAQVGMSVTATTTTVYLGFIPGLQGLSADFGLISDTTGPIYYDWGTF